MHIVKRVVYRPKSRCSLLFIHLRTRIAIYPLSFMLLLPLQSCVLFSITPPIIAFLPSPRNLPLSLHQLSLPPAPRASSSRIRHELLSPSLLRTESVIAQAATATIAPSPFSATAQCSLRSSIIFAMQTRAGLANNAPRRYFDRRASVGQTLDKAMRGGHNAVGISVVFSRNAASIAARNAHNF